MEFFSLLKMIIEIRDERRNLGEFFLGKMRVFLGRNGVSSILYLVSSYFWRWNIFFFPEGTGFGLLPPKISSNFMALSLHIQMRGYTSK